MELLVDPEVSRAKFRREIAEYERLEDEYLRRGWWMLRREFPEVFVVFGAPQLKPPGIIFGAMLDFTNYDVWPASVRLVHPFSRVPYKAKEISIPLKRRVRARMPPGLAAQIPQIAGGLPAEVWQEQQLLQASGPDDEPFLCLPGVREYHQHPGHSGDPWLAHRGNGEGTLHFILDVLYRYGVVPITAYQLNLAIQITGYAQQEIPK